MLTGRRAFEGLTHAGLIATIMHVEPPLVSSLLPIAPRGLDRVVRKCLAKHADDRWQSARDLRDELDWIAQPSAVGTDARLTNVARRADHRILSWALASALGLALGVAVVLLLWAPWRNAPPPATMRLSTHLGVIDASLVTTQGAAAILSPVGNIVAFVGQNDTNGTPQLYVRRLNQLEAAPLLGTNDADSPFFSPDGQWIAFFAGGKLKKIAVTGGAAAILCDAPAGRGGSWGEDGTIVFAVFSPDIAMTLLRVSSAGGTPEPVTSLAETETSHRWPQFLPGAKAILYTASHGTGGHDDADLVVQVLATGAGKIVQRGGYYGRVLASGHLVYVRDATLFAAPFDLDRLEVTGQPVPVLEGVTTNSNVGGAQFDVSVSSTLVYVPGQSISGGYPIHWMDQAGKTTPLRATPANWLNPHFAPDGRRLALEVVSGQADVWIYEWARDTLTRLTLDPASDQKPVWAPDGRRIAFASARADQSTSDLYWQQVDGTTEAQRLTESMNPQLPGSWHTNGKLLAFEEQISPTNYDLMILTMEGDDVLGWKPGKPTVFLNTPFIEREPMFSPDGRWLAYVSNETGRNEVFVRPFPGPGGKWQISTGGGNYPTWSHTKPELVYGFNGQIMVAPFTVEAGSFRAEKSRLWSDRRFVTRGLNRSFDLHPDGERFALAPLAPSQGGEKRDHVTFIFNFFEELRRLAPPTKR
jgi:serine/threonine-protein kinase